MSCSSLFFKNINIYIGKYTILSTTSTLPWQNVIASDIEYSGFDSTAKRALCL
ncbi:MAG: hypothetical protein ACI3ZZ_00925 [Candidatus Aphodosoma sp.]